MTNCLWLNKDIFLFVIYHKDFCYYNIVWQNFLWLIKGAVSQDFQSLFFSLIEPIWVPDKQAKIVFLKIRSREDIRI